MPSEPTLEQCFSKVLHLENGFVVVHNALPEQCRTVEQFYEALNTRGGSDQWLYSVIKHAEDIEISLSNIDFATETGFSKKLVFEVIKLDRDDKGSPKTGHRMVQTILDSRLPRLDLLPKLFADLIRTVEDYRWM